MHSLAMQQWTGARCARPNPVALTYNPAITEPGAIQDLGTTLADVALTSRPGPAQVGTIKYAYAPLPISAVAIAYWVASPVNFHPATSLSLGPRLLANPLTQAYTFQH